MVIVEETPVRAVNFILDIFCFHPPKSFSKGFKQEEYRTLVAEVKSEDLAVWED
jgi:hypothetical protein